MADNCDDVVGCVTVDACETGVSGSSRKLFIADNPTGSGGLALNCNFRELHFRQPRCNYANLGAPPTNTDAAPDWCVGSRWLDNQQLTPRMWICVAL